MVKPICISCSATLDLTPEQILGQIMDLDNWTDFKGYGILPGVQSVQMESKPPEIVGTVFRVTNTDNSSHTERITEWNPEEKLVLHFEDFSAPLSRLAAGFDEIWEFEREDQATKVKRSFELHCKTVIAWPVLKLVSFFLKRAIQRHLEQINNKFS